MAKVTTTASAVLMDVNNGYIYAVVEATAKNDQLANAWGSQQAMDDSRKLAERKAFEDLLAQFKSEWTNVVVTYNRPTLTNEGAVIPIWRRNHGSAINKVVELMPGGDAPRDPLLPVRESPAKPARAPHSLPRSAAPR